MDYEGSHRGSQEAPTAISRADREKRYPFYNGGRLTTIDVGSIGQLDGVTQ